MKTSLLIPCHRPYAKFLPDLIHSALQGTDLPDEIIISLSESSEAYANRLRRRLPQQVPLYIISNPERLSAVQNRNICGKRASGDIFMFVDADDTLHPQKIEITRFLFNEHQPHMLLHNYVYCGTEAFNLYSRDQLEVLEAIEILEQNLSFSDFPEFEPPNFNANGYAVQHGHPAVSRDCFTQIQYDETYNFRIGEDKKFCWDVFLEHKNTIYVNAKLTDYRRQRKPSTARQRVSGLIVQLVKSLSVYIRSNTRR